MKKNLQICRFSNLKSITAKLFLTFAALTITQQLFAQFVEHFDDGDFTRSPAWSGTDTNFVVYSGKLSLQATSESNTAYLTTPSTIINNAKWEFLVQMDFNPSAANYSRIYLITNQSHLLDPLNGYFVSIGNTTDDVSLYAQSGTTASKLIDGEDGLLDLPTVTLRIKVTRDDSGLWELFTDLGPSGQYVSEGTVADTTHVTSAFFGVMCNYTSTRSDKFYFDDFEVTASSQTDVTPPAIVRMEATPPGNLQLTFSEALETETAQAVSNYIVDREIGNPARAVIQQNNTVSLFFEKNFSDNLSYTLTVTGIKDNSGNLIQRTEEKFYLTPLFQASFKDIIFTEIFADPTPRIGLPDVEYLELFNRSQKSLNLAGWNVSDGNTALLLPDIIILPREYVILSSQPSLFSNYGKSFGSSGFPSLNNSGDLLVLQDSTGITIDSLRYSDTWYNDDDLRNGGWSLELIDPENICDEGQNWTGSEGELGGTPGTQNSVFANKPDITSPVLRSAIPVSSNVLVLSFDQKLDKTLPNKNSFIIEPVMEIIAVAFVDPSLRHLELALGQHVEPGVSYSISVSSVFDCSGNPIDASQNRCTFGLAESAIPGDIALNEILFDPKPGGVDFVEIVNTSPKFINLKNWKIGNLDHDTISNSKTITSQDFLFKPGDYLVLTDNLGALKGEYPQLSEANVFVIIDKLPSFNDDAGSVLVANADGMIIDSFGYSTSMHSVFLKDAEGVSLERIDFKRHTSDVQNWKSASSTSGYATPGYLNSNSRMDPALSDETILLDPEVFVPLEGQPDHTVIHYRFDQGGNVANIKIIDSQGRLVKRIANNEILGTEGRFRWEGDRDDGLRARLGYYMVWFEVFDPSGNVRTFFKSVAIATRF